MTFHYEETGPVVVVGAGAAGMAAAISAARQGAAAVLLEAASDLGGIVGRGLIHTIGGLYDAAGSFVNDGLPVELADRLHCASPQTRKRRVGTLWTLSACPDVYRETTTEWLSALSNLRVFTNVRDLRFETAGGLVVRLECRSGLHTLTVRNPQAVIDCTGDANAVRTIDAALVHGSVDDAMAGLVLRLRGVEAGSGEFPKRIAIKRAVDRAVRAGRLPGECAHVWIDSGTYTDEVYVKLSVPIAIDPGAPERRYKTRLPADELAARLLGFLMSLPQCSPATSVKVGELSARGGARCTGDYELNVEDVRSLRRFPDAACRCSWPIEHWDSSTGVRIEYLKDDGNYDVPLRSLKIAGMGNVWCAGKCLSADRLAQASARIAGCCWAMGDVAGRAATTGFHPDARRTAA